MKNFIFIFYLFFFEINSLNKKQINIIFFSFLISFIIYKNIYNQKKFINNYKNNIYNNNINYIDKEIFKINNLKWYKKLLNIFLKKKLINFKKKFENWKFVKKFILSITLNENEENEKIIINNLLYFYTKFGIKILKDDTILKKIIFLSNNNPIIKYNFNVFINEISLFLINRKYKNLFNRPEKLNEAIYFVKLKIIEKNFTLIYNLIYKSIIAGCGGIIINEKDEEDLKTAILQFRFNILNCKFLNEKEKNTFLNDKLFNNDGLINLYKSQQNYTISNKSPRLRMFIFKEINKNLENIFLKKNHNNQEDINFWSNYEKKNIFWKKFIYEIKMNKKLKLLEKFKENFYLLLSK